MIPYILHVTVITTVCFLFYKLLLQKETFYRLNRWTLMGCLAVSFLLPLVPVPQSWSWRTGYENSLLALLPSPSEQDGILNPDISNSGTSVDLTRTGTSQTGPSTTRTSTHTVLPATHKKTTVPSPAQTHDLIHTTVSDPVNTPAATANTRIPAAHAQAANDPAVRTASTVPSNDPVIRSASPGSNAGQVSGSIPVSASVPLLVRVIQWLFYLYLFGVLVFGANFLLQIAVLLFQSYARPVIRDGRFRIVETSGDRAPCSFGNRIFINPSLYDWDTYNQILIHEKIHVSGRHSFDILLAEGVVVLQWFNPFAWMYRKEVENNLEFLTDRSVLRHEEVERLAYQLSLLRVSAPHLPFSITTNYNQSLLKKRIVMMNSKHSSLHTVWKYFFLAPVLTILVCALNKPSVLAGPVPHIPGVGAGNNATSLHSYLSFLAFTDTTIRPATPADRSTAPVKTITRKDESVVNIRSDDDGLQPLGPIEPVVVVDAPTVQASVATAYTNASRVSVTATPFTGVSTTVTTQTTVPVVTTVGTTTLVDVQKEYPTYYNPAGVETTVSVRGVRGGDQTEGSWFVTTYSEKLHFELRGEMNDHSWSNSLTVDKSEINPFPGSGNVTFKLVRDAGTMNFTGQFNGEEGFGHYKFTPDPAYLSYLKQQGVEDADDTNSLYSFFTVNVKKEYVAMVVHSGYPHASRHEIISLAAMKIDPEYMKFWKDLGYNDLTIRELISAKSMKIDKPYVEDLKAAGYTNLPMRELVSAKSMKIDKPFIDELKAAGYDHLEIRELISLKSMKIDGEYVKSMRKAGAALPSPRELISYKSMHIDPEFLASLQKIGYDHLENREVMTLASMHVTADFIKGYQDLGYKSIPVRTLVSMKSMNITPEYVKGFRDLGYTESELNQFTSVKSMNITPDFVKGLQKAGFDHIPLRQLMSLKSMGVDGDYILKMKEKGFNSTDINKYIRLKQTTESFN